jgi:hypothetical protein
VRSRIDGEEGFFRILRHGDLLLGEVAFFREGAHSATAVALEVGPSPVIPADRLEQIGSDESGTAIALIRQLARMAAREDALGGPRPVVSGAARPVCPSTDIASKGRDQTGRGGRRMIVPPALRPS